MEDANLFGEKLISGESQSTFARRVGLSQQRISQLVRAGLPRLPNRRIDPERGAGRGVWRSLPRQCQFLERNCIHRHVIGGMMVTVAVAVLAVLTA